ncbi:MAG: TM2 domain-containing protein [Flavobacteriales bacterium]|nr:TM2 domain-containing protein [Flavobacteriales bacterium]
MIRSLRWMRHRLLLVLAGLALFHTSAMAVSHDGGPFRTEVELPMDSTSAMGSAAAAPRHDRLVAVALTVLLGPFGAHRLYLGTSTKVTIAYGLTFGGFGVLALIDLGHLIFSKDLDRFRSNERVLMWSDPPATVTPP